MSVQVWSAVVDLSAGTHEFKAVVFNTSTNAALWEAQPANRVIEVRQQTALHCSL